MVKVDKPLGSVEAHGQFAQSIIFQGKTAKFFRAPVINKVQAQLDAQNKFQSVTKTVRFLGGWGRGWLQSMYGPFWYSNILKVVLDKWDEGVAIFDLFTIEYQREWGDHAPYAATVLDCGLTFFICAWAISEESIRLGYPFYEISTPGMDTSAAVRAVWDKDLENVFGKGVYDDTNPDFYYSGVPTQWTTEVSNYAYGGSYRLSRSASPSFISFYFYGTRFGILYRQLNVYSLARISMDNTGSWLLSQNDNSGLWQVEWTSDVVFRGLHSVTISRTGADGAVNFDGLVVYA